MNKGHQQRRLGRKREDKCLLKLKQRGRVHRSVVCCRSEGWTSRKGCNVESRWTLMEVDSLMEADVGRDF
jgi:hypothetical protein